VAKGHNVTYEIVDLLKHMRAAINLTGGHVSENGGTCVRDFRFTLSDTEQIHHLLTVLSFWARPRVNNLQETAPPDSVRMFFPYLLKDAEHASIFHVFVVVVLGYARCDSQQQ
jgi:hypothetical protein